MWAAAQARTPPVPAVAAVLRVQEADRLVPRRPAIPAAAVAARDSPRFPGNCRRLNCRFQNADWLQISDLMRRGPLARAHRQ